MRFLLTTLFFLSALIMNAQEIHPSCRHKADYRQELLSSTDTRSDSIDILRYNIDLNITDFVTKVITGNCEVQFESKVNNVNQISLDLLKLIVDSIKYNNVNTTFSYNDTLLKVNIPVMNIGDSAAIKVYYHGVPKGDASGWGGFYFQGGYAYNLGVGFDADPHNYGRVWHPCFDNFVERAKYSFHIATNGGKVAYCNGLLTSDTTNGTTRYRTWVMNQEIPTYLASVAVAGYTQVQSTFNSMTGPKPIILAALPADTNNLKNSFVNLPGALSTFENAFGPYVWDRVGYCLVPFSSGAMEHATNIAFPRTAANGTLSYEADLMAHELAHHWWGDQATCRTAEDMWLNEGWASYAQHIFTEGIYGKQAYKSAVRKNHEEVMHYTHLKEGGYRAVSGVPHEYTYSEHVYLKGADVAHTLRGYMGDTLFFEGIKAYLDQYKFKDASSIDFRNVLTARTGVDLTNFFDNWVFAPGFPHFSIDSMTVVPNTIGYHATVYVKQKLTGAPSYYTNVPLTLTFKDSLFNETSFKIQMSGATSSFSFSMIQMPVYAGLNLDEKINDAIAPEIKVIKTIGTHNFTHARINLTVRSVGDSAFVKIDHNYTAPDPFKVNSGQFRISPNRYWKVDGFFRSGFDASARIYYDGRNIQSNGNGSLDNQLITASEDSVVLLYRKDAADDWHLFPHYSKTTLTSMLDKYGYVTVDTLKKGEYAFGMLRYPLEVISEDSKVETLKIYPSPGNTHFNMDIGNSAVELVEVKVYDSTGRMVYNRFVSPKNQVDMSNLPDGVYFVKVKSSDKVYTSTWSKVSGR